MNKYHYVYILESVRDPSRHYTGSTSDLGKRILKHNQGGVPHTSKYAPWKVRVAIAFDSREQAADFEVYMKSHSGRAFAARHF